jgi:Cu(I)/Ag(I) efflux system periplasmic protein CusF
MKTCKVLSMFFCLTLISGGVASAQEVSPVAKAQAANRSTKLTEGLIRKVDRENRKVTIKHGEIKNLEMPGMTMVFQVKDPVMLDNLKNGDKVQFRAEKEGGVFVVTEIQPGK